MGLLNSGRYQHHVAPCISLTPSSTVMENSYLAVKEREREHKLCTSDTLQNYQIKIIKLSSDTLQNYQIIKRHTPKLSNYQATHSKIIKLSSDTLQNYQSACTSTDNTVVRRLVRWHDREKEVCGESRSRDEKA